MLLTSLLVYLSCCCQADVTFNATTKPYSQVCVCLDIVPLPLFPTVATGSAQAAQQAPELSKAFTQKHMREKSQTLPILHGSFLSLPIHPITQPAPQTAQSLAPHSSAPKTAVITGFRETRWHKMTHLLAVFLLSSFWLDWTHKKETPFTEIS